MALTIEEIIVWVIVGSLVGSVVGMLIKRKKEGFGRWTNLGVGLAGAVIGGGLFNLFKIDLGLGALRITGDDLISAFCGSLIFLLGLWLHQRRSARRAIEAQGPDVTSPPDAPA